MTARKSILACALGGVGLLALVFRHSHTPLYMWNASASAPLCLDSLQPSNTRYVGELVAVLPPEPLATFLADGSYLPRGVPMLKHVFVLPGQTVCRQGPTIFVDAIALGMHASATAVAGHFLAGTVVASLATANSLS